jgi:hypothetical protein
MTCARGLSAALAVRCVGLPSYHSGLNSESERAGYDRRSSPLRGDFASVHLPRSASWIEEMEKRSSRRIRDLVALAAFQGLSQNEIGCARISMMARSTNAPFKGRIQQRHDQRNSVAYLRAISLTWSLVSCFRGTPGGLQVSRKKPSRPGGATIQSSRRS